MNVVKAEDDRVGICRRIHFFEGRIFIQEMGFDFDIFDFKGLGSQTDPGLAVKGAKSNKRRRDDLLVDRLPFACLDVNSIVNEGKGSERSQGRLPMLIDRCQIVGLALLDKRDELFFCHFE